MASRRAIAPGERPPSAHASHRRRPSVHRKHTGDSLRDGIAASGSAHGPSHGNPPRSPREVRPRSRATPTPPPPAGHQSHASTPSADYDYAAADERTPLMTTLRNTFSHDLEPDPIYSCTTNPHTHLPVYTNIHRIRRDITSVVEDYLSPEQLHDMRINLSVVRPLVDTLYQLDDISIVYCLLVNRARFLHEQAHLTNRQNVNYTRATLCELIAHRILRRFNEDNEGLEGLLVLSHILVAGFEPFQNAPAGVRLDADDDAGAAWEYRRTLPALEVAILSEAKFFLSSTSCQKVIEAIYVGRVTYTPSSLLDIIPDRYKQKPIALYDPRSASLLNQYRLIVPRTRNILEACQFTVLLSLYLLFMAERDASRYSGLEMAFSIFSFGWVLDQFATILEHGWHVYTQNLWSFLDVAYGIVYWVYLVLRIHGFRTGNVAGGPGQQALDVMALAAPVLIPRIAFTLLSDNLLFVSLRSMMADFTLLTFLAAWCFAGFLLSLAWLGEGQYSVLLIGKWMVYIWFGLDGTGIQRSADFHWLMGPSLMVAFAFLGNTLFLTILVSMLSHTFSTIVTNATAEIQYRKAVLTLEGVKSDAIFAYQPPFNILALFVLVPLKFFVSPRWFHKIHVACVRSINLPVLLIIAAAERRLLWPTSPYSKHYRAYRTSADADAASAPRPPRQSFWGKWRITAHSDIQAVFEVPPPDEIEEEIAADDDLTRHMIRRQFVTRQQSAKDHVPQKRDQPIAASASASARTAHAKDGERETLAVAGGSQAPASDTAGSAASTLQRSASAIKFADTDPPSVQHQGHPERSLRPPGKGLSRRDSIAFPGLDPDKLRRLLAREADGDGSTGALDDYLGAQRAPGDVRDRLDALEASMQRIEGMLGQLLGSAGLSGSPSSPSGQSGHSSDDGNAVDDDDDDDDDDDKDDKDTAGCHATRASHEEAEDLEAAHTVCDEVIDEDEAEVVGHTGSIADLDMSANER